MKNYIINAAGHVADFGPVRTPDTRFANAASHGEMVLQLDASPTTEQIAAAVRQLSIPKSLPAWRVAAVLKIAGMYDAAMAFIEALPEPQRTITQCAWASNELVERHGALLTAALPALSITDEQADDLFLQAATLVPN